MISDLVNERSNRSAEAGHSVAEAWGYSQKITGPFLVIPYRYTKQTVRSGETAFETSHQILLPETLNYDGMIEVENRSIGIFDTKVYTAAISINADFSLADAFDGINPDNIDWGNAITALTLADLKGLQGDIMLKMDNTPLTVKPGTTLRRTKQGVHAKLGAIDGARNIQLTAQFSLRGSKDLSLLPIGSKTTVNLKSSWPSPGFLGRFSPLERTVSETGFKAKWELLGLALGLNTVLKTEDGLLSSDSITVNFVDTVNIHKLADRSIKYGALFIILTFSVLYIFEIISKKPIHPIQYALTGFALCMFFLVLLSLAEHIAFMFSYMIAASLVVGLVTAYAWVITMSKKWTIGVCISQSAMFGFLCAVLHMEDMALISGTSLLFIALASVMYLTRNVDWYNGAGQSTD